MTCPLADSYINAAAREPGAAAELAASRKEKKYADLDHRGGSRNFHLGRPVKGQANVG